MRTVSVILLFLLVGLAMYGYYKNPVACRKLGSDVQADLTAIYTLTPAANKAVAAMIKAPSVDTVKATLTSLLNTNAAPVSESPASGNSASEGTAAAKPAVPDISPTDAAALAVWSPPVIIPAEPDWTWATPQGIYKNVKITKIEADCVTIIHDGGGALVEISDLPFNVREQLNYSPSAAKAAAAQRRRSDGE